MEVMFASMSGVLMTLRSNLILMGIEFGSTPYYLVLYPRSSKHHADIRIGITLYFSMVKDWLPAFEAFDTARVLAYSFITLVTLWHAETSLIQLTPASW